MEIKYIIIGIIFIIIFSFIGVNLLRNEDKDIIFITINKGSYSEVDENKNIFINNISAWARLWTEMFPTQMIASAIDFEENMLIGVFYGKKNNGGYSIEIKNVTEKENEIIISVLKTTPGKKCYVTQAITSPYHIIEIAKSEKNIIFIEEERVVNC